MWMKPSWAMHSIKKDNIGAAFHDPQFKTLLIYFTAAANPTFALPIHIKSF